MLKISRKAAEKFYADVFALCHLPDASAGRSTDLARSNDPISTLFVIRTPHGPLEVSLVRPDWIPRLGLSVHMRFSDCPRVFPAVGGLNYDPFTGKWGLYKDGADAILAELSARLDWAQGLALV